MIKKSLVESVIATYGATVQKCVAMEEMAELTKEITKDIRGKLNRQSLIEEFADVTIVLDELKLIYNITNKEINQVRDAKLKRLKSNLEKTYDNK